MLEITPSTARPGVPVGQLRDSGVEDRPRPPASDRFDPGDRVELSAAAQEHEVAAESELTARIDALRASIAEGSYLTTDKIDYVVERLAAELFGPPAEN